MSKKKFPCSFNPDVLCPYKKSAGFVVLGRCFKCSVYKEWMREMDEEDEKIDDEIDRERRELELIEVGRGL